MLNFESFDGSSSDEDDLEANQESTKKKDTVSRRLFSLGNDL
eukprot:CAMPEP_0116872924 /NCGR_PEP_ID=MMETSP0463-20121206/3856_1 /TAXON_ID=181622 /ORGANISM="Strombidinopsis sp, Strain SopsisLIS2011" /LENGTH=41 /DNA_ID= /DNA_START= /DNA_END= /DNA_ORIENTATION=